MNLTRGEKNVRNYIQTERKERTDLCFYPNC